MPGAHCVVVGCTNGSYYKLWQWKEQRCPLYDINYGILEVYQLTPAKAFGVFSASYSWLDRMTTSDSSFHVPYNYKYDKSQSFHDVTITLSDIKCNKYDVFPLQRSVCLPLWRNYVNLKWRQLSSRIARMGEVWFLGLYFTAFPSLFPPHALEVGPLPSLLSTQLEVAICPLISSYSLGSAVSSLSRMWGRAQPKSNVVHFSCKIWPFTTRVSRYHKGKKTYLGFTEARDSEWQWHQLDHMQVCTSLQTDNHANTHHSVFHRPDSPPAAHPTSSKHWRTS